jgi:hypothetical protein
MKVNPTLAVDAATGTRSHVRGAASARQCVFAISLPQRRGACMLA